MLGTEREGEARSFLVRQHQKLSSQRFAESISVGGKLIEYRRDSRDRVFAFRQEQNTSRADYVNPFAARHHPPLPFIDEKSGIFSLGEYDGFSFSAIEELGECRHVGAVWNRLRRKPSRKFGFR